MGLRDSKNLHALMILEPVIGAELDGVEPEFCDRVVALDMNVRRFEVVSHVEEKPETRLP